MSDSFILFSLLLYGCIWGSFLMVVGLRVPLHQSIISTPSHCPHCQHRLSAFELIPVLSYLLQRGTCYQCHRKIPPLYPLTESLAAGLLALSYFKANGDLFFFLQLFLLLTFGLIFFVSDLSYQLLPDVIMLPFLLLSLVWIFYAHPTQLMIRGFTGLVFFLLFSLMYHFYPGSIGGGDVKYFGVLAFLVGYQQMILALLLTSLSALLLCLPLYLLKGYDKKQPIPFAPFIFFGSFTAVYIGTAFFQSLPIFLLP